MRYDVLVVGGGPAGSTVARECAAQGLRVLIVDRAQFPRDKPCGGGVNLRAARLLPFDLAPVVERTISAVRFSVGQSRTFLRRWPQPLTYLTQRSRLDAFLLEQALRAGTALREGAPVTAVERGPGLVRVQAGGERFEARALVAADGANGVTARLAGLPLRRRVTVAMEGNVSPAGGVPEPWREALGLDICSVPGGYGWVFPKGDHLNIGVGGYLREGPRLRAHLERLTRFYGYNPAMLWGVRGYHLPVRESGAALAQGNVMLAGDAAGLLDPFSGEGIFAAIWSGQAAARHLAAYVAGEVPNLSGYQREVTERLVPELRVGMQFFVLFHRAPRLCMALAERLPVAWRAACHAVRGDRTYVDLKRRLRPFHLLLDALAPLPAERAS